MNADSTEQRHLLPLYQSVVISVIHDHGLGLTTMSQLDLSEVDRVQNEAKES